MTDNKNNSYVEIFSDGKWKDDESTNTLKFGSRINRFPVGIFNRDERRLAKIIAKEAPRGRSYRAKKYPGTFNRNIATRMAIELAAVLRYKNRYKKDVFVDDLAILHESVDEIPKIAEELSETKDQFHRMSLVYSLHKIAISHYYHSHGMPRLEEIDDEEKWWEKNKNIKILFGAAYLINQFSQFSSIKNINAVASYARAVEALIATAVDQSDRRPRRRTPGDFEQVYGVRPRRHDGVWADTRIVEAQMNLNLARMEIRDRIISQIGTVPRRMARLTTDGKIFERAIPEIGASILIDASGSMAISNKTILNVIETAPASVIAIYMGGSGLIPTTNIEHDGGFVIVLAKDGMMCSRLDDYRFGSSNECDGIGLRWLGMQPEPRYWISDGGVTGPGDIWNESTQEDTAWCLRQFNIKWINTLSPEQIVDIVKDGLSKDGEVLI